ncbi:MAG: carboxypeptidase-like regulatory domain-containing protein, partial [Tannerella sp.]|nr:carboxypeptidase-like regulatory domain-containing protein [Tannerella sp.]
MKRIIYTFLTVILTTNLSAETLKGTVVDAKTGEPIVAASVFFDGTTIGTATGLNGEFSLTVKERIYSRLVISYLGYESAVIPSPFDNMPEIIRLEEKNTKLDEVVVSGKPTFSMAQKRNAFRKIFLGETAAGAQCKILNEADIKLIYDAENKTFSAYSDVPLVIVNRYLKYRINWEMVSFDVQFDREKTLNERYATTISILGFASLTDESHNDYAAAQRREEIYGFSLKRFFHLLAKRMVDDSDFLLSGVQSDIYYPSDSLFTVTADVSDPSVRKISVKACTAITESGGEDAASIEVRNIRMVKANEQTGNSRTGVMRIRDYSVQDQSRSVLTFDTDSFLVDAYGNTDLGVNYLVQGYMGK